MYQVMKAVDKANGYIFGKNEETSTLSAMMSTAVGADFDFFKTASIKEKYLPSDYCDTWYLALYITNLSTHFVCTYNVM